uniref:Uncharacterized protein n=1 Tax=Clastoptera arizonana TaxID=38151 RepID=A0A1B6CVM0_9HEMI
MKILMIMCLVFCVVFPLEIRIFLERVDQALANLLSNPSPSNTTKLFQDLSAYSYNLVRLNKLFSLKREVIMPAAKYLQEIKCPTFLKQIDSKKIKKDFNLDEKASVMFDRTIDKIQRSISLFFQQYELNPNFIFIPVKNRTFNTLESVDNKITELFKSPNPDEKIQMMKNLSLYYYLLGKFIKQFKLGRDSVMDRAKALYQAKIPNFYAYSDIEALSIGFKLQRDEAALFRNSIYNIKDRFDDLLLACKENINFESKVDYSSVFLLIKKDKRLRELVFFPDPYYKSSLLKTLKSLYHLLGYLRRDNVKYKRELYNKIREFYQDKPLLFLRKKIDSQFLQTKFGLTNDETQDMKDFVISITDRFNEFRIDFMNVTNININVL